MPQGLRLAVKGFCVWCLIPAKVSGHRIISDHVDRTHAPLVALIDDALDIDDLPLRVQVLRDLWEYHAL